MMLLSSVAVMRAVKDGQSKSVRATGCSEFGMMMLLVSEWSKWYKGVVEVAVKRDG
jgi:hypothetical protein